jgi:hypothetical protein
MASRNQLLGQMQRPQSDESKLKELNNLEYQQKYLDPKQQVRLDELRKWHEEYKKNLVKFRSFVFHPTKGEKVVESRDEFDRALADGWYGTRADLKAALDAKTADSRQRIIEKEFKEEAEEEKQQDTSGYLVFLKRSLQKESGFKMLYHYTTDELREAYEKLGMDFDESLATMGAKGRIKLYRNLKDYVELHI